MGQGDGQRVSTGVPGMDEILGGGMLRGRFHLLRGMPGAGKTTFALQFLLEGVRAGERVLYFSFSRSKQDLLDIARSHGWSLDRIELRTSDDAPEEEPRQTIFPAVDVELADRLGQLFEAIERTAPDRVVLDAIALLYAVAGDTHELGRNLHSLKRRLTARGCTALLLDQRRETPVGVYLDELADGVVAMEQDTHPFGGTRRRLLVEKVRAAAYREGRHDYRIRTSGLIVFPRLVAADYRRERPHEIASSGLAALDELLGGGLDRGSSLLLLGSRGIGKSSVAMQIAAAAAERGERVAIYLFDESTHIFFVRADQLGMPLRTHAQAGRVRVHSVDAGEWTPGEFAHSVRGAVENDGARVVVIDTVRGCREAMLDEPFMTQHLRELVSYLREQGVVTILVESYGGGVPVSTEGDRDSGYAGDATLLFRRYEHAGEARTGIFILKVRAGGQPQMLHDLVLGAHGISIGPMPGASNAAVIS